MAQRKLTRADGYADVVRRTIGITANPAAGEPTAEYYSGMLDVLEDSVALVRAKLALKVTQLSER